jgi:lauroyl/myristoyl acyltransferase
VLDDVIAEGKGGVLLSGHVGNWEILGRAIALAGYPIATIARPFYDPRITAVAAQVAHAARATNHLAWRQHWQGDLACSAQQSVDGVFNRSGH